MSMKWDRKYVEKAYESSLENIQNGEYDWKDITITTLWLKLLESELGLTTILSNLTGVQETIPFGYTKEQSEIKEEDIDE